MQKIIVEQGGSTKELNVENNYSTNGWTSLFANVADGTRVVQKIIDLVGGTGTKPSGIINKYMGPSGLVSSINDAVDIKGDAGDTTPEFIALAEQVAEDSINASNSAAIATEKAALTAADAEKTALDVIAANEARDAAESSAETATEKAALTAADAEKTALDVIATNTNKTIAETYKDQAAASAAAAAIAAEIKPDTATGIADTVDGEYFWVVSTESSAAARLYRNESGVAVDTGKSVSNGEILKFSVPYRSCLPPTVEDVAFEFVDAVGKRGVAILEDGALLIKAIKLSKLSGGYRTSGYVFDIGDTSGKRVFAVTNQGRVFLKLSNTALDLLSSQLNVYQPSTWRGSVNAEDVLATDKLVTAKIEDTATVPNWYGDIVMPREGSTLCAIAKGTGRLQLYLYVGQSNSQASGVDNSILVEQRFPYHALKYVSGSASDGYSAINISTLNDIVATQDFQRPYPHNAAAMATIYRSRLIGETANPILCRADGKGGAPLTDFLKTATTPHCYNNAMTTIEASYNIAKSYGMDLDPTIVFVQGENSGTAGSGTSIATYQGWLSTLLNDYIADTKSIIKRIPKILIWQTNGLTDGTNDQKNGALAHLAETILRRGTSVVLAAPMYQCPISDTIHGTSIARMMQGELTDLVIREIKRNGSWTPLDLDRNPDGTAKLTRVGTTITGKFNRPVIVDDDWIPTVGANLGFHYTGSGGISSVSITDGSPDFIITLANSVGGVLSYASRNCDPAYYETGGASGENWSAPRGMIYANSGIESVWYQLGYTVPRFIRHYLVRFEENIA